MALEPTRIEIPEPVRESLVDLLNDAVVQLTDLGIQTKLAHWNVRGPHFIAYHELFDEVAGHVVEATDAVAERAVMLGGHAGAPVGQIAQETILPPWPLEQRQDREVIRLLRERVALVANRIRRAIDTAAEASDADTADLFTEVSRQMDKDLWFLEAHLAD